MGEDIGWRGGRREIDEEGGGGKEKCWREGREEAGERDGTGEGRGGEERGGWWINEWMNDGEWRKASVVNLSQFE